MKIETESKIELIDLIVVKGNLTPILSLDACVSLDFIKRIDSLNSQTNTDFNENKIFHNEFKDVFDGLGCLCEIKLKEGAISQATSSARRIPLTIQERFKEKLNDIVRKGIVQKADEPVDCVSNVVIVDKPDGSLSICIDPQNFNTFISRERVRIPTIDEVFPNLAHTRSYSLLDIKDGCCNIQLDDDSINLCNFSNIGFRAPHLVYLIYQKCFINVYTVYKYFGDIHGISIFYDLIKKRTDTKEENSKIVKQVL